MYEETGRPVWYLSAGRMSSPTTYHGDVLQYANGQTISGPYHPPSAPTTVATVDVEFTAMNEATFTFTEGASVVRTKAGRSSSRSLEPELPQTPAFQYPQFYVGSFIIDEVVTGVTFHWFSMQNPTLAQGAYTPGVSMEYVLRGAYTFGVQINGFYGNCSVSGSGEFAMPPTGLALRLTPYAQYTLTFGLPASTVDATISCPQQDPASVPLPFPAFAVTIGPHAIPNIDLTGTRAGVHPGEVSLSVTGSASGATLTENFDFLPTY